MNIPRFLWPAVIATVLSACTTKPAPGPTPTIAPVISPSPPPVEVVHTARYTLVSLTADEALRFPLRQVASHDIAAPMQDRKLPVRGDALKIWLDGTGYGLCLPVAEDMRQLFSSPLPDIHRSLGPLHVGDALQVIAGPAWIITVDEVTRTICFQRAPAIPGMS